ncbi:hypothetical protein K0U07_03550 [bacterium]|nr:hypothetical protein [bacterium]
MIKNLYIFACIFSMFVKPPAHVAVSDKSVTTFAKTLEGEKIKILSVGGFYLGQRVEKLYLDLEYSGAFSDEKAKSTLEKAIFGLLAHVNADEEVLPYLIKEKFSTEDISVSLSYHSDKGDPLQVHLYEGEIIFSRYHPADNSLEKIRSIALNMD